MKPKFYVVYDGDTIIATGTARKCAEQLGVTKKTVQWYASNASREHGRRVAVRIDLEEIEA